MTQDLSGLADKSSGKFLKETPLNHPDSQGLDETVEAASETHQEEGLLASESEDRTPEPPPVESPDPAIAALTKRIAEIDDVLKVNEALKLDRVYQPVNEAYYFLWSAGANKAFRQLATFSKRIKRIQKGLRSN